MNDFAPYQGTYSSEYVVVRDYPVLVDGIDNSEYGAGETVTFNYTAETSENVSAVVVVSTRDEVDDNVLFSGRLRSGETASFTIPSTVPDGTSFEVDVRTTSETGNTSTGSEFFGVNQDLSPIFLSGTVTKADSTAASGQQLNILNGGSEQTVLTNSSGGYNVSVTRNSKVAIGYRHTNGGAELAPEFDDTPDHHYAASLQVGETSQTHDVQLPTAYRVNVTVVDESNTPVENASVDVISYRSSDRNSAFGTGPTLTNSDGQLAYENGSGPGIELSGPAAVIVERPENDTRFENTTYTRELNVSSDTEVTVTLNETEQTETITETRAEGPGPSPVLVVLAILGGVMLLARHRRE
jgi:hypothetical protein